MIGLLLRGLGVGLFPCEGLCVGIAGSIVAICGISSCMKFRMRDCTCIKKWMRMTGSDKFDDFEMMMLVHEVQCTTSKSKLTTLVRVTAGMQVVETDESNKGIFQQPLSIFVEQGTDVVNIELLNYRDRKVLAGLKLDIMKDILDRKEGRHEQTMPMKQKNKG